MASAAWSAMMRRPRQPERAERSPARSRVAACTSAALARRSGCRDAWQLLRLDRVEFVIAAQHQRHRRPPSLPATIRVLRQLRGAGPASWLRPPRWCARPAWRAFERAAGRRRGARRRQRRGQFDVGGVAVGIGHRDRVLAGSASTWNSSDALPPIAPVSACDDAEVQAHAREHAL